MYVNMHESEFRELVLFSNIFGAMAAFVHLLLLSRAKVIKALDQSQTPLVFAKTGEREGNIPFRWSIVKTKHLSLGDICSCQHAGIVGAYVKIVGPALVIEKLYGIRGGFPELMLWFGDGISVIRLEKF